jgi:hypothetical protein
MSASYFWNGVLPQVAYSESNDLTYWDGRLNARDASTFRADSLLVLASTAVKKKRVNRFQRVDSPELLNREARDLILSPSEIAGFSPQSLFRGTATDLRDSLPLFPLRLLHG